MHVLQTVSSTEVLFSGITYCVNELSKGLVNLEQNVQILSLSSTPNSWVSSQNEYKFRNNFLNIPFLNKSGYSSDMKNYILDSSSNIVHTHGLWMFPNIYRNTNAKFVISPHGTLAKNALKFSPIKKKIFYSLFQKKALADARLFFASAESEFDDIRNYRLKAPIAIIPHGVNIPNIKKAKTYKDKKIAVSIGRLHPKKGLDTLIKTWSRIEPIFSQWDLKIVGPNESGYQIELEKLINKLKLSRVTIEPPLYGLERDLLLSSCDLFCASLKNRKFCYDCCRKSCC